MPKRRVLVTWIGHADLRAVAAGLAPEDRARVLAALQSPAPPADQLGPIRALLQQEAFDEVHLLSTYPEDAVRIFKQALGRRVSTHPIALDDPTDYGKIYQAVDGVLGRIAAGRDAGRPSELAILLSPGTPAMAAVWVLLGKSTYSPATFYQSYQGRAWVTDIPVDLAVDYVPRVLRGADATLQEMAARSPREVAGFEDVVGESRPIRLAVERSRRAAVRDVSVLLLGESGTGKEMFAHAIHRASRRAGRAFVAINCAALPKELLESELFGHRKGAFTGADTDRKGAFEEADGGTLFLDEVGECEPSLQATLLRVLQPTHGPCNRVYYRVGETRPRTADVRVVAATNRDLHRAVAHHAFREDLYHRLAVITVQLPPLRERRPDIPPLAEFLLGQINEEFGRQEPGYKHKSLSAAAREFVKRHPWPGNVRQLYNALLRAAVMADGETLDRQDLAGAIDEVPGKAAGDLLERPLGDGFSLEELIDDVHRHYLRRAMDQAQGVKTRAAELLGMKHYQTLDQQLRRLKVEYRPG